MASLPVPVSPSPPSRIRVAPKLAMKSQKKARNVFFDNRGFPDESDAYDHLLHNIDGGVVLRKKKFDAPALDQDDPDFNYAFDESLHGDRLRQELNYHTSLPSRDLVSHLLSSSTGACSTTAALSFRFVIISASSILEGPNQLPLRKSIMDHGNPSLCVKALQPSRR